jgi:ribosomal protein S18 acetylase RimI-like enzyme
MAQPEVVSLTADRLDETVEVLAESFFNYPTMRYVLRSAGASYPARLRDFVRYLAEARFRRGNPVLGVDLGEPAGIVAAALIDKPGLNEPDDGAPTGEASGLVDSLGEEAVERLRLFNAAITPLEPDFGFYYLGMVGVLSGHRGRGLSSALMDRVIRMSAKDRASKGVLLTTEHEANVGLYEGMGFVTLGEAHTPDRRLFSWTMFRTDR